MPDETPPEDTPTEGEIVPPIVDYTPEVVEPEPQPVPATPPGVEGPQYPAPGEGTD